MLVIQMVVNLLYGYNIRNKMKIRSYFLAKNLDEAYKKGYFNGSMQRTELMERITRYNPQLCWKANATYRGLFDTTLHVDKAFICGIPHNMTIPKYSLMEYDFSKDRKLQWCTEEGKKTGTEIVNAKEHDYKVLARGWKTIFCIIEKRGYRIDKRGL